MAAAAAADPEQEALRHKSLAESKYNSSNLKSALKHAERSHKLCPSLQGISSMLTAFRILSVSSKSSVGTEPDWYRILQVEPFSNINTIKKQFKKLALVLHPDKNPYLGCEEAFKLVNEGVRIFSDKIKRKEYDMKLRIKIQEERVNGSEGDGAEVETFWTACSRCRLLHKFERKYLRHNLVCPSCKKSFEAVEVGGSGGEEGKEEEQGRVRVQSEKLKRKMDDSESLSGRTLRRKKGSGEIVVPKGKMGSGETAVQKGKGAGVESSILKDQKGSSERRAARGLRGKIRDGDLKEQESGEMGGSEWGGGRLRRRTSTVGEVLARSKANTVEDGKTEKSSKLRVGVGEETMTLAEMQLEMKRKLNQRKGGLKQKEREKDEGEKENKRSKRGALMDKILEIERQGTLENGNDEEIEEQGSSESSWNSETSKESVELEVETQRGGKKNGTLENMTRRTSRKNVDSEIVRHTGSASRDLEIMAVKDTDFYNFDKDRIEKNFKKGQVWAIYDDDDGMPRHYGLIDEVVSVNPFEVKVSWLDLQNNGDERLISLEKMEFSLSCGRFKVSRSTSIHPLNIFSHVMECERAAKELYRIYPKKGSVWALYDEAAFSAEGRSPLAGYKRCYHIVVSLTTYSDIHGLSIAYLEKVDGFKTIFKRQEIGCHAIRWLEKDGLRLFSHQIPARKLSSDNVPDHLKDCWEVDPTSLPSDLLTTSWK